jgi:hypothetical protein
MKITAMMKASFVAATALLIALVAAPQAAVANIVVNGGFETGDFTGWTEHACSFIGCGLQPYFVAGNSHAGSFAADTGCVDQDLCFDQTTGSYIKQTLATSAGSSYTLSFWLDPNGTPAGEEVFWNGAVVGTFLNEPAHVYTQFTINDLLATSDSTVLQFDGFDDPEVIFIDDIAVNLATGAVPEPMPLALLSLGLVGMAIARRKKR